MRESTCANCGKPVVERYDGTFWKAPDLMPTTWYHDRGEGQGVRWQRACAWAEPMRVTPPAPRHEHDAAGCLEDGCSCFAGPPNSLPCTCPTSPGGQP